VDGRTIDFAKFGALFLNGGNWEGDKGQFIYMSPLKNLVIVRNRIQYGIPSEEWFQLFYKFASRW
jgi:hypothetical protein